MALIDTLAFVYVGPSAGNIPNASTDANQDAGQNFVDGGNSEFADLNDSTRWELRVIQAENTAIPAGSTVTGSDSDTGELGSSIPSVISFSTTDGGARTDVAETVGAEGIGNVDITYKGTTHELMLEMQILENGQAVVTARSGTIDGSITSDPWDALAGLPGNNGEIDPALLSVQSPIAWMSTSVGENIDTEVEEFDGALICFASGTMIATPDGEVSVESLSVGAVVRTLDHGAQLVKWIGRQTVSTRFGPAERLMPVRVRAGALGDGLPVRDLTLTADHALLIDGLLINAGALVNGGSIDWVPLSELGDSYTVYHIETEDHDIILAEGAPAETFIDYVGRRAFDNHAEYLALYGEDRTIPEMPYPRISTPRLLPPALKARLAGAVAA